MLYMHVQVLDGILQQFRGIKQLFKLVWEKLWSTFKIVVQHNKFTCYAIDSKWQLS